MSSPAASSGLRSSNFEHTASRISMHLPPHSTSICFLRGGPNSGYGIQVQATFFPVTSPTNISQPSLFAAVQPKLSHLFSDYNRHGSPPPP